MPARPRHHFGAAPRAALLARRVLCGDAQRAEKPAGKVTRTQRSGGSSTMPPKERREAKADREAAKAEQEGARKKQQEVRCCRAQRDLSPSRVLTVSRRVLSSQEDALWAAAGDGEKSKSGKKKDAMEASKAEAAAKKAEAKRLAEEEERELAVRVLFP